MIRRGDKFEEMTSVGDWIAKWGLYGDGSISYTLVDPRGDEWLDYDNDSWEGGGWTLQTQPGILFEAAIQAHALIQIKKIVASPEWRVR